MGRWAQRGADPCGSKGLSRDLQKCLIFPFIQSPLFVEHLHVTCSLQSKMGLVLAPQSLHSVGQTRHKQTGGPVCKEEPRKSYREEQLWIMGAYNQDPAVWRGRWLGLWGAGA